MEGLYLVHTCEFLTSDIPIYKIGRNNNINKVILQYSNGSQLLFISICKNSKLCEQKLIEIFKQKFTHENVYGNKYYSGDCNDMIDVMYNYIKLHNKQNIEKEQLELQI